MKTLLYKALEKMRENMNSFIKKKNGIESELYFSV